MTAKITNFANLFLTPIKNNLPFSPLAFQCGVGFFGGLVGVTSLLFATSIVVDGWKTSAQAQITPAVNDANTIVNQTGNNFNITGGTQAGANLFHSFQKFGLDQGQIANFLSNPSIQNILGRVTGGDASVINGQIKVTGGISNLYLINPAGIIFGQGASLSLPGSFTATTANGIGLDDKLFKALGTNDYASLIGNPNGFAFTQSGGIFNAGNLAVESGQSLTLVGGSVINTGTLSAHNGNITISAVPGERFVRISESGSLLSYDLPVETKAAINQEPFTPLSLPQLLTVGSISKVTNATVEDGEVKVAGSSLPISNFEGTVVVSNQVDVSGVRGGSVNIQGDRVSLINANINALGTNGGGEVFISSGDFGLVKNSNSLQTFVSQDSTINAELVSIGIIPSPDLLPPDYFPNPGLAAPGSLPDQPLPPFTTPPISLPDQPLPSLPDQPLPVVFVTPTKIEIQSSPPPIESPTTPPSFVDRPLPPVAVIPPVPTALPSFVDRSLPIQVIPSSIVDRPLSPQLENPGVYPSFPDQPLSPVTEVFTRQPSDSGVSISNVNLYQFEQVTAQQQPNRQGNNSCNLPNNVATATLPNNSNITDRSKTTVSNLVTAKRDRCHHEEDDKQILQLLTPTP